MLRGTMWLPSVLYGIVMRVRNICYDKGIIKVHRAGVPVICIGNRRNRQDAAGDMAGRGAQAEGRKVRDTHQGL
jgi:hypothetical protein